MMVFQLEALEQGVDSVWPAQMSATTGEPSVIDVSLLGVGMWQLQPDIVHAKLNADQPAASHAYDRKATWNPLSGTYRTRDGRFDAYVQSGGMSAWDIAAA